MTVNIDIDIDTPYQEMLSELRERGESGQDAQGSLEFETPRNWVSGLSPVENDVIGIKRLF